MENKSQKLLCFSPYYPPHIGGVENYTEELSAHLAEKGFAITIFTPHIPNTAPSKEIANSVEIIRFPAFEIISNYPLPKFWVSTFWKLFFELFKRDFDTVISQTRFFSTSLLALTYTKTKKVKWLHIEHGSSFVQTSNIFVSSIAKTYDLTFGKIVLNSADQLIAISQSVKTFVKTLVPKKECSVIYRGFDFEKIEGIKPNSTLKEQYANDKIVIFIGRLISGKGVSDLLQAFANIKKENVKLFIIGDGPEKEKLEELTSKLCITNNTIFFGYKSFEESVSILKIADFFVNPSYSEGLPTTVMEAAICQKAIIATNVGGTNEIIENDVSGIIIPASSPKLINESLLNLLSDTDKSKSYGNCAYQRVKENFSWEKSTANFIEIITK